MSSGVPTATNYTKTRSYNALNQLTEISVPGAMDLKYTYSSAYNNGKITQYSSPLGRSLRRLREN